MLTCLGPPQPPPDDKRCKIVEATASRHGREPHALIERIHPAWVLPGGGSEPLSGENRDRTLAGIPDALSIARRALDWVKTGTERFRDEIRTFANFPRLFVGLVGDQCGGRVVQDAGPGAYADYIAEIAHPWTNLKTSFYKPLGYPEGIYRVGALPWLDLIDGCGTPLAGQEWVGFRVLDRGAVLSSLYYHYARPTEILYSLESKEQLLHTPAILDVNVRAHARVNNTEGVGVSEALRDGLITWANLIIATGHNNAAMNRGVFQVARHFVHGNNLSKGMLSPVEAVSRTLDPCLSCSTHADGRMALDVELFAHDGALLERVS